MDKNEIIKVIKEYIQKQGSNDGAWYVGKCEEPHSIVLTVVTRTSQNWMYIESDSCEIAKEVLDFCINSIGLASEENKDFDTNKGNIIFIYKKSSSRSG
jgi:hypothetical protein